jgi:hypothetical protein
MTNACARFRQVPCSCRSTRSTYNEQPLDQRTQVRSRSSGANDVDTTPAGDAWASHHCREDATFEGQIGNHRQHIIDPQQSWLRQNPRNSSSAAPLGRGHVVGVSGQRPTLPDQFGQISTSGTPNATIAAELQGAQLPSQPTTQCRWHRRTACLRPTSRASTWSPATCAGRSNELPDWSTAFLPSAGGCHPPGSGLRGR